MFNEKIEIMIWVNTLNTPSLLKNCGSSILLSMNSWKQDDNSLKGYFVTGIEGVFVSTRDCAAADDKK